VSITAETLRHVAELAALELAPGELEGLRRDLAAILDHIADLARVDTQGVEPTSHVLDVAAPLRPDAAAGVLSVDEALRNAPRHDGHSLVVPKVVE
jgi:aspartyl-tRNA(Asn)/glutamyl-tRNA(Gln) amidotransferase subunit C